MRGALVLAIVIILVAAGIGTGYEFGNANSHTETTTSTADRDCHSNEQRYLEGHRSEWDIHGTGMSITSRTGVHGLAHPLPSLHELHHVECLSSRIQRQGLLRHNRNGGINELEHLHDLHCLVRQLDRILRESLLVGERAPDVPPALRELSGGGAMNPVHAENRLLHFFLLSIEFQDVRTKS